MGGSGTSGGRTGLGGWFSPFLLAKRREQRSDLRSDRREIAFHRQPYRLKIYLEIAVRKHVSHFVCRGKRNIRILPDISG